MESRDKLPDPTNREQRNYFEGLFTDERRPLIIREIGKHDEILNEEHFYTAGHRFYVAKDGTVVDIDNERDA